MRKLNTIPSSNVRALHHDAGSNTLQITFANGSVYSYQNVTDADAAALERESDSIGRAVLQFVRNKAAYPCTRVS